MLREIRTQLLIIIISFSLLVLGSFAVTFLYIQDHSADEITEEIIREHRLLIQRLTWLALVDPQNPSIPVFRETIEKNLASVPFTDNLIPLEGEPNKLPAHTDNQVRQQYQSIAQLWPEYLVQLEKALNNPEDSPADEATWIALQSQSRQLINGFDSAAETFEQHTKNQHTRLRALQIGFFIITVPLIIAGIYIIGYRIVRPLNALNQSALRISTGDFHSSIEVFREDEIGQLAHSMDAMRAQISANQQNLEANISERTHELTIATRFSQEIARQMDAEKIITSVTILVADLFHAKDVSLCLLTPNGEHIQMVADGSHFLSGDRPQQAVGKDLLDGHQGTTEVARMGCQFLNTISSDQVMSSSLQVGEKIIGALCVLRGENLPFNENEQRIFTLLANSAAIAIYNNQLVEKGKQKAKDSARLAERQQLASDLHDDLAQNLGVSQLQVNQILSSLPDHDPSEITKMLEVLQANLRVAHEQVRMVISGLTTRPNENTPGLQEDIKNSIADFNKLCDIPVKLQVIGIPWEEASQIVQRQLLLILREALVNIRRHAHASRVDIAIAKNTDLLVLQIRDNGRGFNPEKAMGDQHFGLEIMHARADRSGGKMEIISSPGAGTEIKASFPLNKPGSKTIEIGEMVRE